MAIDLKSSPACFVPVLETQKIEVMLRWPVQNFNNILVAVEARRCYEKDGLFKELIAIITEHTKGFGFICETMQFDEIALTFNCGGVPISEVELRKKIGNACRIFWNRYSFFDSKEVLAAQKNDRDEIDRMCGRQPKEDA